MSAQRHAGFEEMRGVAVAERVDVARLCDAALLTARTNAFWRRRRDEPARSSCSGPSPDARGAGKTHSGLRWVRQCARSRRAPPSGSGTRRSIPPLPCGCGARCERHRRPALGAARPSKRRRPHSVDRRQADAIRRGPHGARARATTSSRLRTTGSFCSRFGRATSRIVQGASERLLIEEPETATRRLCDARAATVVGGQVEEIVAELLFTQAIGRDAMKPGQPSDGARRTPRRCGPHSHGA